MGPQSGLRSRPDLGGGVVALPVVAGAVHGYEHLVHEAALVSDRDVMVCGEGRAVLGVEVSVDVLAASPSGG